MSVRSAETKPTDPAVYLTNLGVAKLGATGGPAAIVAERLKLVAR